MLSCEGRGCSDCNVPMVAVAVSKSMSYEGGSTFGAMTTQPGGAMGVGGAMGARAGAMGGATTGVTAGMTAAGTIAAILKD